MSTSVKLSETVMQTQDTAADTFWKLAPKSTCPTSLSELRSELYFPILYLLLTRRVHYFESAKSYIMLLFPKYQQIVSVLSQIISNYLLHSTFSHIFIFNSIFLRSLILSSLCA